MKISALGAAGRWTGRHEETSSCFLQFCEKRLLRNLFLTQNRCPPLLRPTILFRKIIAVYCDNVTKPKESGWAKFSFQFQNRQYLAYIYNQALIGSGMRERTYNFLVKIGFYLLIQNNQYTDACAILQSCIDLTKWSGFHHMNYIPIFVSKFCLRDEPTFTKRSLLL